MPDININQIIMGYFGSGMFWLVVVIIAVFLVAFFIGFFNRRSKLKYNHLEFVRYGNGKVGVNLKKAGVFGVKSFLKFWDYGQESVVKSSDGKIIEGAKTSHLHDVFGKKGYITIRNPKDPKILVPINRVDFDNLKLLLEIAPSDYRDASTRIFREAVEETKGTWEKILPFIAIGICVFLCIITIVISMQITNNAINKVGNMLIEGCQNAQNIKPGGSP